MDVFPCFAPKGHVTGENFFHMMTEEGDFPGAVKGRGMEIDVVVQMALVGMGADEKLVLAFRPAHRRFITDFVCLVRRHLAGRERLPDLEEQRSTGWAVAALPFVMKKNSRQSARCL